METDSDDDPYCSIFSVYCCGIPRFELPPPPSPPPSPTHSQPSHLFGPIPDHLLHNFLCYAPLLQDSRPNPTYMDVMPTQVPIFIHDDSPPPPQNQVEHQNPSNTPMLCVMSYQDSPPSLSPTSSPLAESECYYYYSHEHPIQDDHVLSWLSLLKSFAVSIHQTIPICSSAQNDAVSFVAEFRNFKFRLGSSFGQASPTSPSPSPSPSPRYLTRSRNKLINAADATSFSCLLDHPLIRKNGNSSKKHRESQLRDYQEDDSLCDHSLRKCGNISCPQYQLDSDEPLLENPCGGQDAPSPGAASFAIHI